MTYAVTMSWGPYIKAATITAATLVLAAAACSSDDTNVDPSTAATSGTGGAGTGGSTSDGGTTSAGGSEPVCPHVGDPVLDPSSLPSCEGFDTCRCLPSSLIPPDNLDDLADCDANNKCVPDLLIETGGNFIPETCESIAGAEGRCLATCLPAVADQADLLPQSTCAAGERCAPCYDPFDATETGACRQSCDPGPTEDPVTFTRCCGDRGSCIPAGAIPPDDAENLDADTCGANLLCVPDGLADGTFMALSCSTSLISSIFGSAYEPGACLPDCLPATDNFSIRQDGCPDGFKCAPCLDPLNGGDPTGACDFL